MPQFFAVGSILPTGTQNARCHILQQSPFVHAEGLSSGLRFVVCVTLQRWWSYTVVLTVYVAFSAPFRFAFSEQDAPYSLVDGTIALQTSWLVQTSS
eukprot:4745361-Pyramimonas_sp.AAC.1